MTAILGGKCIRHQLGHHTNISRVVASELLSVPNVAAWVNVLPYCCTLIGIVDCGQDEISSFSVYAQAFPATKNLQQYYDLCLRPTDTTNAEAFAGLPCS